MITIFKNGGGAARSRFKKVIYLRTQMQDPESMDG